MNTTPLTTNSPTKNPDVILRGVAALQACLAMGLYVAARTMTSGQRSRSPLAKGFLAVGATNLALLAVAIVAGDAMVQVVLFVVALLLLVAGRRVARGGADR